MSDRIVLITGAKGGLGTFVTQRFLETGATVVGTERSISQKDFAGGNVVAVRAGLTKPAADPGVSSSAVERYGRLDVLVHLLGRFAGGKSVAETDDPTWHQMQDLNHPPAF